MLARIVIPILLASMSLAHAELKNLSDQQMAAETGQALFSLGYIAPGANNNPNTDIGFYKLGMQAQVDINANIQRLRLGCDTPTSSGTACDIDASDLALTGIVPVPDKYGSGANDSGVPSDFTLNNPYIELAIKSPTNAAQRRLVGFKLGAESAWGLFSVGQPPRRADGSIDANNQDVMQNPNKHTGITSISGYLPIEVSNVVIPTVLCEAFAGANDPYGCNGLTLYKGESFVNANNPKTGDNVYDNLYLKRQDRVKLPLKAKTVLDLTINGTLDESLKFAHLIRIGEDKNGNGRYDQGEGSANFSISSQANNIFWQSQGQWDKGAAQAGWWLNLPRSTLGNFTTRTVYATPGAVFGLSLKDVNLNQVPVDNCYGSLKYC